jgi:predicted ArsR family transcriptional regulator
LGQYEGRARLSVDDSWRYLELVRDERDTAIGALGVLADRLRREMYDYVRRARRPITRDEAAAHVGISRKLAAFHLDKLTSAGLLQARYERAGGGPTIGRTPKVYEASEAAVYVAIPARRHDLLAEILLDTVRTAAGDEPTACALKVAADRGRALGAAEFDRARPGRLGPQRAITMAAGIIETCGYEPDRPSPTELRLRNCPFHPMAGHDPALVCGINHAFLRGVLDGLHARAVDAVLQPTPGECCVRLRPTSTGPA